MLLWQVDFPPKNYCIFVVLRKKSLYMQSYCSTSELLPSTCLLSCCLFLSHIHQHYELKINSDSRDHRWCQESNLSPPHARQMPTLLCYHYGLSASWIFVCNKKNAILRYIKCVLKKILFQGLYIIIIKGHRDMGGETVRQMCDSRIAHWRYYPIPMGIWKAPSLWNVPIQMGGTNLQYI